MNSLAKAAHPSAQRRWHPTISFKLLVINALAVLAVCGIAWQVSDVLRHKAIATDVVVRFSTVQRLHLEAGILHDALRTSVYGVLLQQDLGSQNQGTNTLAEVNALGVRFRANLDEITQLNVSEKSLAATQQLRTVAEDYIRTANEIAALASRNRQAALALHTEFLQQFKQIENLMGQETQQLAQAIHRAEQASKRVGAEAQHIIGLTTAVVALVLVLAVAALSYSIRKRLRSVSNIARQIAAGELTVRAQTATRDEVGSLARSLNTMADSMHQIIEKLRAEAERDSFSTQLAEALEMADSEPEVYQVAQRAMQTVTPDHAMELLLADSSQAKLERATQHPAAGAPNCGVESPFSCAAVRRGNTVAYEDSEALNACAQLRGRPCGAVSAVCVPISFMGRSMGVLHTTGVVGQLPAPEQIQRLMTLGVQAGARIGTVRAFRQTQLQAATDALTGLANRRSGEDRVHQLQAQKTPYALVMADLDKFKALNDSYGHASGDRALKLFAETIKNCVRQNDLCIRWGGEEFAILMPNCKANKAFEMIERLRATLAQAILVSGMTPFTSSFGIADSSMAHDFSELVRIADDALYCSKEAGRDRATIGEPHSSTQRMIKRPASEHDAAINVTQMAAQVSQEALINSK